jgi:hypothetical protein
MADQNNWDEGTKKQDPPPPPPQPTAPPSQSTATDVNHLAQQAEWGRRMGY